MTNSERLAWNERNKKAIAEYEALDEKGQAAFILGKEPVLCQRKSITRSEKEKWPGSFWCYRLNNSWDVCRSGSREETMALFKTKTEGKN